MYSIRWEKALQPSRPLKRKAGNFINVIVTCLDDQGKERYFNRRYEEWMGVCTNNIERMVRRMQVHFPGCRVRYVKLRDEPFKKVLPYFEQRLQSGKLDYVSKPFYKIYSDVPLNDVGDFFDKYKISYYESDDWLSRIYLDMCCRYHTISFFYKWYDVGGEADLMDSFRMKPENNSCPNWTIAAFDLETVPLSGENRVPTGADSKDVIVSISIVKWNRDRTERYVLYYTPCNVSWPSYQSLCLQYDSEPIAYHSIRVLSETDLLKKFHELIDDAHVLTGYNIDKFDIPCILSRLMWLGMSDYLKLYTSKKIGDYLVAFYKKKLTLDMLNLIKIYSNYDLPSHKLDDVAHAKLGKFKIPLKSTGLHAWYTSKATNPALLESLDVHECFEVLKSDLHGVTEEQFGHFRGYIEYCLIDSELVRLLFMKEMTLLFLLERANFTAMDAIHACYYGNSRYLLELFKTYGTVLGFFINMRFFKNQTDSTKYQSTLVRGKYQGALNYCIPYKHYRDISVMDFNSMYPRSLLNANLCYGTSTILTKKEYLDSSVAQTLTAIPFRNHDMRHFDPSVYGEVGETYRYPVFDPEKDLFVIVVNQKTKAFLPELVLRLLDLRQDHQRNYKKNKNVFHYISQLNIKILINSLYGIMGCKDSLLAKLQIAMSIVTLARYQILASYHYMTQRGYVVTYVDTDSLMVQGWPVNNCDDLNRYLNMNHIEIKYEDRYKTFLILTKKRYVFETQSNQLIPKGFVKKTNNLIRFMTNTILKRTWQSFQMEPLSDDPFEMELSRLNSDIFELEFRIQRTQDEDQKTALSWLMFEKVKQKQNKGWVVWVETLIHANYMCRNPKTFSIMRKTKKLDEYKSDKCASVRMLKKYPEKAGEFIEFTFSRADTAASNASDWIMDVDEVEYVNFEKLFMSQRKTMIDLLNLGFWNHPDPLKPCLMVINSMRWKCFVHAELKQFHVTKQPVILFVERGVEYSFEMKEHLFRH